MTTALPGPPTGPATDEPAATPRPEITADEQRLLALLADGHTHESIGRRIGGASKAAVRMRLSRLYQRIGARSAAHAVAIAYRTGALPVPDPGAHQQ